MATKLQVWKQALVHLEKATITTLTDDVEAVYVFGNAWEGAVEEAFNSGDWNFAKASVALSPNGAVTPAVGWSYAFDYPSDWLRTVAVSNTPNFDPFHDYVDEGGHMHANTPTLYLRHISDVNAADDKIATTWPTMFWRYVALKLAFDTCGRLTAGDTLEEKLRIRMEKALRQAKNVDARNENNKVIRPGSWLKSRVGAGVGGHPDNGGTLVGGQITFGEGDV